MISVKQNDTAVVILNYNGKHWLEKFLPNVLKYSSEDADVIVADNASTDDSVAYLKQEFPQVELVILDKNYGFAGGYNESLKQLDYTYLVLLNSDVEVSKDWIKAPKALLKDPKVGAVQPKLLMEADKTSFEYAGAAGGYIDRLGYSFCRGRIVKDIEKDLGQYNDRTKIFWASGAAMFVKSEVFWKAGGFDASFFAHYEEIDLCWRMKSLGYDIYYEPNSKVYHVGGGTLSNDSPKKTYLNFRNSLAMLYKNLPASKRFSVIFSRLILDGVIACHMLLTLRFSHFSAVFKAHFAFYGMLKDLKTRRIHAEEMPSEIYNCNIITDYILSNKRKFSELRLHKIKS